MKAIPDAVANRVEACRGSADSDTEKDGSPERVTGKSKSSHASILRSSALVGSATIIALIISALRTKVVATLLGPAGLGLMGMFNHIADVTRSVAEMGINSSGVRQIAAAASTSDALTLSKTVAVLRKVAILLGLIGVSMLVIFSEPISALSFNDSSHAGAVALLSVAVFLRFISDGQGALLLGTRRIADMSCAGIIGAVLGTALAVPLVFIWREKSVVPVLIAISAGTLISTWWYSQRVTLEPVQLTSAEFKVEAISLLRLGFAFMGSGLLMMGSAYMVRLMVIKQAGLEAAGLYQSAWTLASLYIGFLLQAMATDFYPRLVGVADDNEHCNQMVNEQAQVGILLAGPGVIATLAVAPWVLHAFYSEQFSPASDILRWFCVGMALRVVSWPLGFILVAKAKQALYLGSEFAWTVVSLSLSWILINRFGAAGAGMAFFGSYVFHMILLYPLVRHASGFRWSSANCRLILIYAFAIAVSATALWKLPSLTGQVVALGITLLSGAYSAKNLVQLLSSDANINSKLTKFFTRWTNRCPARRS
jgi:PST family polysaccharide transporter